MRKRIKQIKDVKKIAVLAVLVAGVSAGLIFSLGSGGNPRLGVEVQGLSEETAGNLKINGNSAVLIIRIIDGSRAEMAGLIPGDVITAVNGKKLDLKSADKAGEFAAIIKSAAGGAIELKCLRNGSEIDTVIPIGG